MSRESKVIEREMEFRRFWEESVCGPEPGSKKKVREREERSRDGSRMDAIVGH